MIFATLSLFIESYLIIYEQIPIEYIHLIHLIIYLIIDLCYPINSILKERLDILFLKRNDKNEDDDKSHVFNPRDTDDVYPD